MTDYKLVPVEPTPEMLDAAIQDGVCVDGKPVWKKDVVFQAKWKYQQMLAAAPQAPAAPVVQVEPVSAQVRYRRPEKGQPDWSVWQPAAVMLDRPSWEIDSQGYEVEYRLLYDAPQPTESDEERLAMEAVMESVDPATWPGLTTAQRCALGRFAKPQPAKQRR